MSERKAHDPKLNIGQRLLLAMDAVKYVKKDVDVPGTGNKKGVARDAVIAACRQELLNVGVIAVTSQVGPGRYIETAQKSSTGTPLSKYVAMYITSFRNVDDKDDYIGIQHEAQGDDYGDKAPGKAATYAEKLNFVKGLMLETGIADEGRNKGEGDDDGDKKTGDNGKGKIAEPQRKSTAKADAKADDKPASKGLLKQIKDKAELDGTTNALNDYLKSHELTLDTLTDTQAKKVWKKLGAPAGDAEPGSNG